MPIATNKIAQEAVDSIAAKIDNLNTLNIIITGKTGAGKSLLINSVFRDNLADTVIGKPVTDHIRKISKVGVPLTIYDTPGLGLGREVPKKVKQEVLRTINEGLVTNDINSAVHCIWYCINASSNRVEQEEICWLRELSEQNQAYQVPIVVVLTQSLSRKNADEMKQIILAENLNLVQVVPVLAADYEIDENYTVKAFGLEELIQVMGEFLPDELMDTLKKVQIASLNQKINRARRVVVAASVATSAEAATPIPFADYALIIPTQVVMVVSITVLFGFEISRNIIKVILSSILGAGGATLLRESVVSSLLKLIPGVGTVTGSTLSTVTAGAITASIGVTYIEILSMMFNGDISIEDFSAENSKENISSLYKEELDRKH